MYKAAKAWKGVCSRSLHHRVPPVSPEQQSPLRGRYLREEHNAPLALTATHRQPRFLPLSIMFHPLGDTFDSSRTKHQNRPAATSPDRTDSTLGCPSPPQAHPGGEPPSRGTPGRRPPPPPRHRPAPCRRPSPSPPAPLGASRRRPSAARRRRSPGTGPVPPTASAAIPPAAAASAMPAAVPAPGTT